MPAVVVLTLGVVPASASAATATSVVMLSDPGDYIGGGDRLFTPANGSVTVSGDRGYLTVDVSGGTSGDAFRLDFAAPAGQTLAPGAYEDAQRAPFREAGRPGIDIDGDGRDCNTISGRFDVKDLATGPGGAITRLWIVYEQHCEGAVPALFGEVRIGEPIAAGSSDPAPAILRWPGIDVGRSGTVVPVTVVASAATQITSASFVGAEGADFPFRLDECTGQSIPAGGSCQVQMRFTPSAAGEHAATLRIADATGAQDDGNVPALRGVFEFRVPPPAPPPPPPPPPPPGTDPGTGGGTSTGPSATSPLPAALPAPAVTPPPAPPSAKPILIGSLRPAAKPQDATTRAASRPVPPGALRGRGGAARQGARGSHRRRTGG